MSMVSGRAPLARYRYDAGDHSGRDFTALSFSETLSLEVRRCLRDPATHDGTSSYADVNSFPNGVAATLGGLPPASCGHRPWRVDTGSLAHHRRRSRRALRFDTHRPPPTAVGPRPSLRISARDGAHPGYRTVGGDHRGWGGSV